MSSQIRSIGRIFSIRKKVNESNQQDSGSFATLYLIGYSKDDSGVFIPCRVSTRKAIAIIKTDR